MEEKLHQLLQELDDALAVIVQPGQRLDLYNIGRSALILHYNQSGMTTKDLDIVSLRTELEAKALELFGKGTANATALGVYREAVPQGLPPVPHGFLLRCQEVEGGWKVIRLWRPEPHDLAATKVLSFRSNDRQDIQFLCEARLLKPDKLREAMEQAWINTMDKDGDPLRERAFANLEKVLAYLNGETTTL
jgi:Nucleotidyltransferase of unknown function (DUF6036)